MRHTHTTLLLSKGENVKVVSERLGHSSVAFTLKTYAHVLPGMQEGASWRAGQKPRERNISTRRKSLKRREKRPVGKRWAKSFLTASPNPASLDFPGGGNGTRTHDL
ncbi:tyrosine-type recombinase/integrase [Desulfofundulus thermobenzoicus]|uniref:Tyrosine-type recombinase/integrase n=1 Tax=Desulfofundulus thermobenzoicus TaxID=29376 RepID=A0A6N7ITE3_9FIRM|nr:tyrosine-type recombinase/integrase [Desulfofundulus thermobenzoicus]